MLKIKITNNFDPNELMERVTRAALAHGEEQVRKRLAAIRCPDHGNRPGIAPASTNTTGTSREMRITGCCQKLIDLANGEFKKVRNV